MEKKAKSIPGGVISEVLEDLISLSLAKSAAQAIILRQLFFVKWERNVLPAIAVFIRNFKENWCNDRLANWTHGHIANYVNNTKVTSS